LLDEVHQLENQQNEVEKTVFQMSIKINSKDAYILGT